MANVFKNSMQVLLKSKRSSNLNEKMSRMLEINIEQQMERIEKSYGNVFKGYKGKGTAWKRRTK